jgi:hypothetical protein
MKKALPFLIVLTVINSMLVCSQTIVVTAPQHKNVVLEEYTGIHCGYCPDGHARAQAISDANPGRVVLVNIHQGSFAVPSGTEPEFRTIFGDSLADQAGVDGYPAGTINRHIFPELNATTSLGRGAWFVASQQIFPQQSPVNIGFTSTFDSVSRDLTVYVELYYTAGSPAPTNYLNVALLENHVYGYQSDYANGTQYNYDHKHILRWFLTGQWGDTVNSTSQGSLVTKTYVYNVPAVWNISNCDVAVYVAQSHNEIYSGVQAVADGGTHNGETAMYIGTIVEPIVYISQGTISQPSDFSTTVSSSLAGSEDFEFTLTNDAPGDWTSSFTVDGNQFTTTGIVTLANYSPVNVSVSITPGNTPSFATYTLTMTSVSNPSAPPKIQKFYVISGITDLIVNGTGGWGDGNDYNFDQTFLDAVSYIGTNIFGLTDAKIMTKAAELNALSQVQNIYLNIGWRFPSLADDQATSIMAFMDNGGNVFISGQDIGWDIKSGDGYGTTVTANFYDNYLHAVWIADGAATNNQLTAITSDGIFGAVPSSGISDIFDGNMYPEEISPGTGASGIFNYNGNASKVSAIRFQNSSYKVVYIGVDMAMIDDDAVSNEIIKLSYQWFHGLIDIPVADVNNLTIFPNPSCGIFYINGKIEPGTNIDVFDASGRKIVTVTSVDKSNPVVDMSSFSNGLYFVTISDNNHIRTFKLTLMK